MNELSLDYNNSQELFNSGNNASFASDREAQQLLKAIEAGQITGTQTLDQSLTGQPLKIESVEATLKPLVYRLREDIKLFPAMPKLPAKNTVEQYLQLVSYGINRGGFYNEGELPSVEDSVYRRRAGYVKFIQVAGEVTLVAQYTDNYINVLQQEIKNKVMWVLRKANEAMTKGDSSIIQQEFDGLYKLHASVGTDTGDLYQTLDQYYASESVIDLRGKSLTQIDLEEASVRVDQAFGSVDSLFGPPTVTSGLSRDYFQQQRIMLNAGAPLTQNNVQPLGLVAKTIPTSFGNVNLMNDKSLRRNVEKAFTIPNTDDRQRFAASATSLRAPNAPNTSSAVLTGANDPSSKFAANGVHTDELGTVFYAVSALNRFGESALTILPNDTTKVTLTAGRSVDLTFTDGGGAVPATGYQIYRSKVTSATNGRTQQVFFYPIFQISTAQLTTGYDGGAAGVVRDRNRVMPDTEQAFQTQLIPEVLSFKQMRPISKLDLSVIAMSRRFVTFLWGMPLLYAPKKLLRFINIGPYVESTT